jgi:CrcB protein
VRSIAVFVGGAAGALARWALGVALAAPSATFPWATLVANISGAFGLGFVGVLLTERLPPRPYARPLVVIGIFGSYTTFSTMALEGVLLIERGRVALAILYWLATLILGQMAGVYGMWLGRIRLPARKERV